MLVVVCFTEIESAATDSLFFMGDDGDGSSIRGVAASCSQ